MSTLCHKFGRFRRAITNDRPPVGSLKSSLSTKSIPLVSKERKMTMKSSPVAPRKSLNKLSFSFGGGNKYSDVLAMRVARTKSNEAIPAIET